MRKPLIILLVLFLIINCKAQTLVGKYRLPYPYAGDGCIDIFELKADSSFTEIYEGDRGEENRFSGKWQVHGNKLEMIYLHSIYYSYKIDSSSTVTTTTYLFKIDKSTNDYVLYYSRRLMQRLIMPFRSRWYKQSLYIRKTTK